MEESLKVASRCFMFMYYPTGCLRQGGVAIGEGPTTLMHLRISRFGRSMTLFVRIRVQCSGGKSQ